MLQAISLGGSLSNSGWTNFTGIWNSGDAAVGVSFAGTNDRVATSSGASNSCRTTTTIGAKTYAHFAETTGTHSNFGVANSTASLTQFIGQNTNSQGFFPTDGTIYYNNSIAYSTGVTGVVMDIWTLAVDGTNLWIAKNGDWIQGSPLTGVNPYTISVAGTLYFMGPRTGSVALLPDSAFPTF